MEETIIIKKSKLKIKNGYLIVGLPGIGLIGKTVADYLITELKGKLVGELYSPHFPHQVFMSKSGVLRPIKNSFYHIMAGKNDLIILTGDVQAISSHGQYEICGKILDYCKEIGVKTLISLGGYSSGRLGRNTAVFGLVNNKKLIPSLKKHKVIFGKAKGSIVGAAGIIPTFGNIKGFNGICLLGETHGAYVDPASARDIVRILSSYLDFKIDLSKIEKKAKEGEEIVKKIEEEIKKATVQPPHDFRAHDISYIR